MGQAVHYIPAGVVSKPPVLKGEVGKLGPDARTRIERLINVMKYAHMCIENDNAVTLKIFTVPEFYFRSAVEATPYTFTQYRAIKDVLRATLADSVLFKDWLVIAGTIVWKFDQTEVSKRISNNPKYKILLNTALIIKPLINGIRESATIEKFRASPIDGLPPGEDTSWASSFWWGKYASRRAIEKHFFNVGPLNLGLEVCLEHDLRLLRGYSPTPVAGMTPLNLQLLIAAGMPLRPRAIAIKSGGFILRNDGASDGYQEDSDDDDVDDIQDDGEGHEDDDTPQPVPGYTNALRIQLNDGEIEHIKDLAFTQYLFPIDNTAMRMPLPAHCLADENAPQGIRIYEHMLL
jgi:hypothetical protein